MELYDQLNKLIDLAESLGMLIRRAPSAGENPEHPGGAYVRLKGQEIIFLDPTATLIDQIGVVAGALSGRQELDSVFIPPELREIIEKE